MLKRVNKENAPMNLNVPQIKLKLSNSRSNNQPTVETQRSPKITSLFQKIQQSIEQKTDNQPFNIVQKNQVSYHQLKIREKLRGSNQTPTLQGTQESQDSFNIWNDDKQMEGNIVENYIKRYKSYGNLIQQTIQPEEITDNLLQLMGMKHKMKNLGNIPFFINQEKKTNYFLPSQNCWKLNKKKVRTYNSIVQNSTQNSQCLNNLKSINSAELQFQNLENLRKLNSPDILKMKFKCYKK